MTRQEGGSNEATCYDRSARVRQPLRRRRPRDVSLSRFPRAPSHPRSFPCACPHSGGNRCSPEGGIVGIAIGPAAVEGGRIGLVQRRACPISLDEIRIGERPAPNRGHVGKPGLHIGGSKLEGAIGARNQQRVRPQPADLAKQLFIATMGHVQIGETEVVPEIWTGC